MEAENEEKLEFESFTTEAAVEAATYLTSTIVAEDPYQEIKDKLPWLDDILQENGTLTTPLGSYKLSTDDGVVTEKPACPATPVNGTAGVCTPLRECPQVFSHLTDVKVFNKYFCPLDEYAGICCPKKDSVST